MKEITLILTPEDILVIQEGLLELPAKKSLKTINKLTQQATAQIEKDREDKDNG